MQHRKNVGSYKNIFLEWVANNKTFNYRVYFAEPNTAWQGVINENGNRVYRYFIQKRNVLHT